MPKPLPDYREVLQDAVEQRKQSDADFSLAQLAERTRIQRSYLTHVFKHRAHLSQDQLYLVAQHLRVPAAQARLLSLLLEHSRCQVPERAAELAAEIRRATERARAVTSKLKRGTLVLDDAAVVSYYTHPAILIVHMALTVPRFRADPAALRKRLGLPEADVARALDALEQMGILRREGGELALRTANIHLPERSEHAKLHGMLFRLRGIEALQKRDYESDCFFTATFSASRKSARAFKARLHALIAELSRELEQGEAEDVFHLNIDLFPV
jgi:uncharacterized protein (TIGR02147 family)